MSTSWPLSERALPAPPEQVELLRAPDQRGEGASAEAPAAARAHDLIKHHRCRHAPERVRALVFGAEEPGNLALNVHRDKHRTRLSEGLNAADARKQLSRVFACVFRVDLGERAL